MSEPNGRGLVTGIGSSSVDPYQPWFLSSVPSLVSVRITCEDLGKGASCGPGDLCDTSGNLCARLIMGGRELRML